MQSFRVVEELSGVPADFWAMLLDPEYIRAFNATADISAEVTRFEQQGARVLREVRYRSQKPVPALLRPFMPDGIGYVERGTFDRLAGRYEHRLQPTPLGERCELCATITLEPTGSERFLRVYEGTVSVRVPILGARLEREALVALDKPQPRGSEVTRAWLERLARERRESSAP
jgi:hypothetical protein